MIEFTSFRRHFLSLLSNSNKIWPLWNPGNLVCWNTRLNTFQEIWSFLYTSKVPEKNTWLFMRRCTYLGNCVPTVAYYVVERMLLKLTWDHLKEPGRFLDFLLAFLNIVNITHFFLNYSRVCKCRWYETPLYWKN